MRTKYGEFKGTQLSLDNKALEVNYLRGEFGKCVIREAVRSGYASSTEKLSNEKGHDVFYGANPYNIVAINYVLRTVGLRLARLNEIEDIIRQKKLIETLRRDDGSKYEVPYFCGMHYAGLIVQPDELKYLDGVLEGQDLDNSTMYISSDKKRRILKERTEELVINTILHKELLKQITERIGKIEGPKFINFADLYLHPPLSGSLFQFSLLDDGKIIDAPQFSTKNIEGKPLSIVKHYEKIFYETDRETGLPINPFPNEGEDPKRHYRRLCYIENGLSELNIYSSTFYSYFLQPEKNYEFKLITPITVVNEVK